MFVFVFWRGFQVGFLALLAFRAWVSASLCISGWVFAGCSQSFVFDLGCLYFCLFFLVFLLFFFFGSSSLVLDGFWS